MERWGGTGAGGNEGWCEGLERRGGRGDVWIARLQAAASLKGPSAGMLPVARMKAVGQERASSNWL